MADDPETEALKRKLFELLKRPDFATRAREWLVRAQGHAREPHEKSLAEELRSAYELGLAHAIEAVAVFDHRDAGGEVLEEAVERIRALTDKPFDPRGN